MVLLGMVYALLGMRKVGTAYFELCCADLPWDSKCFLLYSTAESDIFSNRIFSIITDLLGTALRERPS
jgi:hypothetical protein